MKISFLPTEFLINGKRKLEDIQRVESTFMLRAIRIVNDSPNTIELDQYRFEILEGTKVVKTIFYEEPEIKQKADEVNSLIEALPHPDLAKFFLGSETFWKKENFSYSELKPNQETGLRLEHFVHMSKEPVSYIVFTVFYREKGEHKREEIRIPIKQYTTKNQYIFPLKGAWIPVNTFDNPYEHRRMHSQEFGFDLVKVDKEMSLSTNSEKENEKFSYYGEEVLAIADGTVVDTLDIVPDNPAAGELIPDEEMGRLIAEYGYLPVAAGNYIVIEHSGEEHSFYAHLIPKSLKVNKGDKVKQGQVLGLLGNSGNSTAPHLHFQLMQGKDPLTARGLPCKFSNLTGMEGEPIEIIDKNFSIVYAK